MRKSDSVSSQLVRVARQNGKLFRSLVAGRANSGPRQKFAQRLDFLLVEDIAVMGVMQKKLLMIQDNAKARTMGRLDRGSKVIEQGFNVAPMNVATDRVLKNSAKQVGELMAHDSDLPG